MAARPIRLRGLRALQSCQGMTTRRIAVVTTLLAVGVIAGGIVGTIYTRSLVRRPVEVASKTPAVPAKPAAEKKPVEKRVFSSPLAGSWYPGSAQGLTTQIDTFLQNASGEPLPGVQALLMPHAGYRYSGQTAAYALRAISGARYGRVVVMGPSHRVPMRNAASVPEGYTHYATLLGEVPLDVDFMAALREHSEFRGPSDADVQEHSVQIELPLLQKVLGSFQFVPIVVGQVDAASARSMGQILLGLVDKTTLVVASSDFTHYGPNYDFVPFREEVPENLKKLDMGAWECIEKKDAAAFNDYVERTGATICGRCPIAILLSMLPEASRAHLLHYDTSGQMMDDFSNSVSYVAAAFTGEWPKGGPVAMAAETFLLTEEEKKDLLKLARGTLTYYLEQGRQPKPEDVGVTITPTMETEMGAFVTLHKQGQLRGCIGEIFPRRALYEVIMEQAVNAGVNDYRFPQVTASELPEIDFEISALTPPHEVPSYQDIVIGRDGMVLRKGGRRAVFLPQVAPEQGWDLAETLTHLSMKAGLPADAWKEGASYLVFEAVVFGEKA